MAASFFFLFKISRILYYGRAFLANYYVIMDITLSIHFSKKTGKKHYAFELFLFFPYLSGFVENLLGDSVAKHDSFSLNQIPIMSYAGPLTGTRSYFVKNREACANHK